MELRDYLRILRKGWPLILAFVVVGSALGIGLTVATTKVYQANVQVFVATANSSNSADLNSGNTFTTDRVQSYITIATAPRVTDGVIKKLHLQTKSNKLGITLTRQALAGKITADAPQNKVLINLHVTDTNARRAATLANTVAAQFNSVVEKTDQTRTLDGKDTPAVSLTVIQPATVPTAPIKPSKVTNIGLGLILGLLVGIGIVVLRDVLDNTVKSPADFEPLGIPVLSLVPFDKRTPKVPIAFRADPHGARAEAYRQLRTNLQFINVDNAPRVIAVTSAVPGEGKTTTALNLAAALAEGGYRVCLIEADLRRPTIAKALGLISDVGFTTALIGKVSALDVLQNAGRNLAVLTSGPVPPNPSELLITSQARAIIREVAATVDYTIIDTAPLLPVADGAEVAALADATLVVHHAGRSTKDQAARSVEALAKVGEKPVGVILNRLVRGRSSGYEYGYYYTYRPDKVRRAASEKPSVEPAAVQVPTTVNGSSEELPEVSYAVPDLPPLREPTGRHGVGEDNHELSADDGQVTALDEPDYGSAAFLEGPQNDTSYDTGDYPDHAHGTNGYPDEETGDAGIGFLTDDDIPAGNSRAERWRELRERRAQR